MTLSGNKLNIRTLDPEEPTHFDNIFDRAKDILKNEERVFTAFYAGMGCQMYMRKNHKESEIEAFFMHSDSWGQYGHGTSEVHKLNAFKYGYRQLYQPPSLNE